MLQFSLAMLALVMLVAAIASLGLRRWVNSPSETVTVRFGTSGVITIDDETVDRVTLSAALADRAKRIADWGKEPALRVVAAPGTAHSDIVSLLDRASKLDYNQITLGIHEPAATKK